MSSKYNNDSAKSENCIPKWINEDYFHPIVQKDVQEFASIKKFTSVAATQPGDNFASVMVRVILDIELKDGSEQSVFYILKTMFEKNKGNKGLFPKEKQMYQDHIPNFIRLYKEAGVDIELAPKCVHIDESPDSITLVLKDLKHEKFENVDRLKGFDMEHMCRVLRKVAELHAASAVTYEQNGPYDEMYSQTLYKESSRPIFEEVFAARNVQYLKAMREWQLPDVEKFIAKVRSPKEYFDTGLALNNVDENEFNCLNHGDLWCNNIMFSEDRTLFVDFQLGRWGSPAQDLWYIITTSPSLDIKVKEFDHFIQIYHTRLVECLKLLKYSKVIPTLRELHVLMIKYGDWGLMTATGVLSVVLMPPDTDVNLDMVWALSLEGDAVRYKMFVNPYYIKTMVQLLPFFYNKGLL
ncbi:uncharacterized protein LOC117789850 [Drosophila innubila]|uniref:uncharacterized protein LOC117789850 n=1 Tax=Drosophila innubila TaxID=198719 RepID=UPI00148D4476|nr:uncharacterized protein LOC117789850 [Drosophila innubila]XP_034484891.1 uncharacterized protein LOC117789850 [Drosophila innubila]XP_034484893.1 uncharacterized protein LOC117789850 [Drosophila innubila]XP_034484894.1 uncharacterized protein LOC117789850 [Drosophila innubila]XP_034484895.1 uncharacterized protein LOC117789850 [Drosophila innubila]